SLARSTGHHRAPCCPVDGEHVHDVRRTALAQRDCGIVGTRCRPAQATTFGGHPSRRETEVFEEILRGVAVRPRVHEAIDVARCETRVDDRALDGVSRDLPRSAARRSGVRTFADADEGYLATDIVESDRGSPAVPR